MSSSPVHVAVAVIKNQHGQVFIARRHDNVHQGGLWEFPGGKIENDESVKDALIRELYEEIGVNVLEAKPLIRIYHDYPDKSVLLDVWEVSDFSGEPDGKEGQETRWVELTQLGEYDFPDANIPIIKALSLPDKYMITGLFSSKENLLEYIQSGIKQGLKLIQFRAPWLTVDTYFNYSKDVFEICLKNNVKLLLNTSLENYQGYEAYNFSNGLHLNSQEIKKYPCPYKSNFLLSTSVHNETELKYAEEKDVDLALLSPLKKTPSHPSATPIGWREFNNIVEKANTPVFALGGMTLNDIDRVKMHGGQGIAAIGEFWKV